MEVTRLSSKGQVIIPKALRADRNWAAGQALIAEDIEDAIRQGVMEQWHYCK